MECVFVFPHQLFENHPAFAKDRPIFLIEDPRFFSDFSFHKQKLVFHRASMKSFEKGLKQRGYRAHYVEEEGEKIVKKMKISLLHVVDFDDVCLKKRISSWAKDLGVEIKTYPSPGFLTDISEFSSLFEGKENLRCDFFYVYQRKRLGLLLDERGKPLGGKWSFDPENRRKLSKSISIPPSFQAVHTKEVEEAILYVEKKYPNNPGHIEFFNYAVTHQDAEKALDHFLRHRLAFFGDYEDAIVQEESVLFHSCLSPYLNAGLLTAEQVVDRAMQSFVEYQLPLNSIEGFVRQIIGWREFIRGTYHLIGEKERKSNFFHHKRKLPKSFYDGTTGILPLDGVIQKVEKYCYAHHIERLMVIGNFFFLCEIDPDEVYRWFMELFIDSYDWVMVPNVYGMSQYADGGMITTKPYFSGSNYLLKMSDYKKGPWCEIWDALFWRFMIKNSDFFERQPRLSMLCELAKKKKSDHRMLSLADHFLSSCR